jgi:hypothetical protein
MKWLNYYWCSHVWSDVIGVLLLLWFAGRSGWLGHELKRLTPSRPDGAPAPARSADPPAIR